MSYFVKVRPLIQSLPPKPVLLIRSCVALAQRVIVDFLSLSLLLSSTWWGLSASQQQDTILRTMSDKVMHQYKHYRRWLCRGASKEFHSHATKGCSRRHKDRAIRSKHWNPWQWWWIITPALYPSYSNLIFLFNSGLCANRGRQQRSSRKWGWWWSEVVLGSHWWIWLSDLLCPVWLYCRCVHRSRNCQYRILFVLIYSAMFKKSCFHLQRLTKTTNISAEILSSVEIL